MTYEEAKKQICKLKSLSKPTAEAVDMAIEALEEIERHKETFEWCGNCKEYDQKEHCCHRWTKLIRDTVDEINENANGKYRWHNIRKNPNDLPKIDDMVVVCFEWKGKFSGDIYTEYTTTYHNGILFDGFQNDDLNKVIAWREIEPFEESI